MQSTCSIHDKHVRLFRFCGCYRIEDNRRRVTAFFVANNAHLGAIRPNRQLLACRRTEGIRRRHRDRLALTQVIVRQLANRGRFAHPVDTDKHNHARVSGLFHFALFQDTHKHRTKQLRNVFAVLKLFVDCLFLYPFNNFHCRGNGNVRFDEQFFQLFVKFVAKLILRKKHPKLRTKAFFCLFQRPKELVENPHNFLTFFFHYIPAHHFL